MDEVLTKTLLDEFDPDRDARYANPIIYQTLSTKEALDRYQLMCWREDTAEDRLRELASRHNLAVLIVDTDELESADLEEWIDSRGIRYACIFELATAGLFFPRHEDALFVKLGRPTRFR